MHGKMGRLSFVTKPAAPRFIPATAMQQLFNIPKLLVALMVLFVIFLPLERIFAIRAQKVFRKGWLTDATHFVINEGLRKIVIGLTLLIATRMVGFLVNPELQGWIKTWPFWFQCVTAITINDFGGYWGHRLAHSVPFLWRFHAVHHSSETMDWLAAARVHPVDQAFMRACGVIPVYLLGFGAAHFAVLLFFAGFLAIFIHANVRWRYGWLEWLVATPPFHHWHHNNDSPETINKNFSDLLPVWDKIFGTLHLPKDQLPRTYGIDQPMAKSYLGQLAQPFVGSRPSSAEVPVAATVSSP
jgi:sterol desaturase/sphingolipid hydroxylase (fatty acid hydroxylase superfamily)